MRNYRLDELADERFEELVVVLCRSELGTGTVSFTKGKDGGRDGRFEGAAERFPSSNEPWSGKFIIQAKHTSDPIADCSDKKFHGNTTSVIAKEIPRIKALAEKGELDNYILFTNRKLSGDTDTRIRLDIIESTGVKNVQIVDVGNLSRMIMLHWGDVRKLFPELAQAEGPLRFYRQDIAAVLDALRVVVGNATGPGQTAVFEYIDLDQKNDLNSLSERFFAHMQEVSSPYFGQIQGFLGDPINRDLVDTYDNIVADFNQRITVHRDAFATFDAIFLAIYDSLIECDRALENRSRFIQTLLHYMYWACDLGEKSNDKTNTTS